MERITIEICTGTACFVMGASDLLMLEEHLPESMRSRVVIQGAHCFDWCRDPDKGKPPFVRIQGELLDEATIPKVTACLNRIFAEKG